MRRPAPIAVLAVLLLGDVAAADAPPDHEFGERGQYLLTTDSRLSYARSSYGGFDDFGNEVDIVHTRFDGRIAMDRVLLAPRLTVGVHMGFEADTYSTGSGIKGFLAGARIGRLFALGSREDVELWPRAGLAYGNITYQYSGGGQVTEQVVRVQISAPLLWRPVARFFVGIGPRFEYDLYSGVGPDDPLPRTLTLGFEGVLGVWFHGM
jgi:hypothetical protein